MRCAGVTVAAGLHRLELSVLNRSMTMPKAPAKTPASYEAALEELEQLVGLIESGQLPLEQLLTGYQRGAELLQFCRDKLQAVENQIKVLDEGTLKPWTQA
jgi:exodeoxyribonuclease VII small subunit